MKHRIQIAVQRSLFSSSSTDLLRKACYVWNVLTIEGFVSRCCKSIHTSNHVCVLKVKAVTFVTPELTFELYDGSSVSESFPKDVLHEGDGRAENGNENYGSSVQKRKLINCDADQLTHLVYERALEEVNELDKKRQRLEVISARPSINFTALVGYKRLQYAGPHESRTTVSRLYNFDKLANISGGFRLYLRLMTDAILNEICDKIDDLSDRFDKSKDMDLCVLQILRYTWSQLSKKERLTYETAARRKIQMKYKAELNMQWVRSLPAMPLTEFRFMSVWAKNRKKMNITVYTVKDPMHILYGHYNMYVYACHCCFEGFTSLEQLKQHCCEEFTRFMLQLLMQNAKLEMMFAMHTMICAECNLQNYHSTDKLVSCVTLFAARPSEVEYITVKGCAMKCGIPLQCKSCSHKFISATDIEKHQLNEHSGEVTKLKCPVCPRFYVTDCFYRDHLLSHLGEVHSMVGILEKATFWPPAFSRKTSFKMGPSLHKIIGSNLTELSRVDKSNDLSDNEDESYEKSVMTKPLQSSLCRCAKSKCEPKAFVTKNSFMKSLVEKFSREGRLYVDKNDSIMDTTIGAVIDDSVFICVKCKGLHFGDENTLKHLRICMQKNVESPDPEKHFDLTDNKIAIRLTQSHCSPNGRISCPECEVTCCSIAGLRRHLALDHGIFAYYNIPESHRTTGIMEYIPPRVTKDTKLDIAARINLELNLTPTGDFKLRHDKTPHSPVLVNGNSIKPVTSNINSAENIQTAPMSVEARSNFMQAFMEPSQNSTMKEKFTCVVCFATNNSSQQLANHFVHSHLYLCSECGTGFVEKHWLLFHLTTCQKWPRSDGEFFPRCSICSLLLPTPDRYFYHLLHCHDASVHISQKNQQVNPMFIWKKLSLTDAAKFRQTLVDKLTVKTNPNSVADNIFGSSNHSMKNTSYTESAAMDKFFCALCELDFSNQAECESHLQKHPEQWNCCPVCTYFRDYYPVHSVSELLEHLLSKHTIKSLQPKFVSDLIFFSLNGLERFCNDVKIACSLCRSLSSYESTTPLSVKRCEEQMIRHILYSCNGTQVCFLCNDGAVYSPEKLKKHRVSEHRTIFERFGCSECSRKFYTCSAFMKHFCSVLLKCSCGISKLFTEEEFEKHFEIHLNSMKDFCLLCNKYLFSKEQLLSHMISHRITVNGKRQLIQLDMAENVLSFPSPNTVMPNNTNINVPFKEHSVATFRFGKVKTDNNDDEIEFLGFRSLNNNTNSSDNKDENKHGDDNDVVFVAETVPVDFMTNIRSEFGADTEEVPSFYKHSLEATPTISTVEFLTESDEMAINNIMEKIIDGVILPWPYQTTSDKSDPSTTAFNANATNMVRGIVREQNCSPGNERSIKTTEKELTSAKTSCIPMAADDENDILIIEESKNESTVIDGEVLKEAKRVSDKIDDIDFEILGNTERRRSGSRKISKREAKFRCNQCTEKFLTKASLLVHKETHKYDAGQTIEAVYGIPVETNVYICRLCCLAYELQAIYQMHMRTHGILQNCERCSIVTFNEEQMRNHHIQHMPSTSKQQVVYVCSKCVTTYSTDERLYHHMFSSHAQAILYFCKNCGLANTNGRVIYEHIVRNGCSWRNLSSRPEFAIMGFTAACIFHYQPINPAQYENRLRSNQLLFVIPSECIHRSFLSQPNDVINITCPTCSSLMSFLRLQAENPKFTGSLPRTLNHAADDNDAMMLTMLNIWRMENVAQQSNTLIIGDQQPSNLIGFSNTPCTLPQVAMPSGNSAHIIRNAVQLPSSLSGICISQNQSRGAVNNIGARQPSSQISWIPARQALSTASVLAMLPSSPIQTIGTNSHPATPTVTAFAPHPSASSISAQTNADSLLSSSEIPPYLQPYRGALEAVGLTVGTQMVTRDYIIKNAEGKYFCARSECANVRIEKITSGRVHNLRHNPQNLFLLGMWQRISVRKSYCKAYVPSLNLRCPLCPLCPPFTRIELLKSIWPIRENIQPLLILSFLKKVLIECKLHFYSIEARLRHDHEHRATKNAPCCFVCGTSRNWWFSPARADFPYIDHSYIHAFSLWGMCRECGLCYPNELKNQQYFNHFKEQHMIKASDSWQCKICNIKIPNFNVHTHALQRHFVVGIKTDHRKSYAIETSDAMMRAFLGYPVPDNARI
ncbi:Zinc finger protein [Dirofilaria immitis]|nr:Zinc finger protein [Dirofilaria immitis]